MAIPKWHEFFPAVMRSLMDGKPHSRKDIQNFCINFFKFIKEEIEQRHPKSGGNVIRGRISWAISSLKDAGLIRRLDTSVYIITDFGKEILTNSPEHLTYTFLHQYGDFKFFSQNYSGINNSTVGVLEQEKKIGDVSEDDPLEKIESAFKELNDALCKEILEEIMKISDYEFEKLVIKLLVKMGYGSLEFNKDAVTQKSRDEGIDGIVTADKLGFESICTQAKRWNFNSIVGRPEIQKFLGALVGKGANKGLFITTAEFSKDGINFAKKQSNPKIVLIDGKYLAELMIEYGLGVNVLKTFKLKRLDSDFFNEIIN